MRTPRTAITQEQSQAGSAENWTKVRACCYIKDICDIGGCETDCSCSSGKESKWDNE